MQDPVGIEEEFFDSENSFEFEEAAPNIEVNFEEMAHNYFARIDEIHGQTSQERDGVLDFFDFSSVEEDTHRTDILEDILREATEPLYEGSNSSRLHFSIILMSLCTLYSVSHHYLDEILTFVKHNVLPGNNNCPKNSYKMKALIMKLGLSHESIHYYDCGR